MNKETVTQVLFLVLTAFALWTALMVFTPGVYDASTLFIEKWGGFLGGFFGAMGAFGAAWWTIERQRQEQVRAFATELVEELESARRQLIEAKEIYLWREFGIEDSLDKDVVRNSINEFGISLHGMNSAQRKSRADLVQIVLKTFPGEQIFQHFRGRTSVFERPLASAINALLLELAKINRTSSQLDNELGWIIIPQILGGIQSSLERTQLVLKSLEEKFDLRLPEQGEYF